MAGLATSSIVQNLFDFNILCLYPLLMCHVRWSLMPPRASWRRLTGSSPWSITQTRTLTLETSLRRFHTYADKHCQLMKTYVRQMCLTLCCAVGLRGSVRRSEEADIWRGWGASHQGGRRPGRRRRLQLAHGHLQHDVRGRHGRHGRGQTVKQGQLDIWSYLLPRGNKLSR